MPNVAQVLREEVSRLARKRVRAETAVVKRATVQLRHDVAQLKKRVAGLEREVKRLSAAQPSPAEKVSDESVQKARFTSEGIKALRRRLGVSQRQLAELAGVTAQAVWLWENKDGPLRLRTEPKRNLLALRSKGKREVGALLEK